MSAKRKIKAEIVRCKRHEKVARHYGLISAEQAWRFRRWGIEWAMKHLK